LHLKHINIGRPWLGDYIPNLVGDVIASVFFSEFVSFLIDPGEIKARVINDKRLVLHYTLYTVSAGCSSVWTRSTTVANK